LRRHQSELETLKVQVLVVDPHERYRIAHMLRTAGTDDGISAFPILGDPSSTASATYGVAMQMRIHGEWSDRPATFIIDQNGVVRYQHLATKYSDRPKVEKILSIVRRQAGVSPAKGLVVRQQDGSKTPATRSRDDLFSLKALDEFVATSPSGYTLASVFHPRCSGCLTEAIALKDSQKTWQRLQVNVLGLAVTDREEAVARFAGIAGATYRLELAPWANHAFDIRFYPTLLVFDREGKEVFRAAEDVDDSVEAARTFVEEKIKARSKR
jgi:peroxiredoxin